MRYAWDDFNLDRNGTLLTRQGQQVDVSRKILDCITYLIEQRHRVVSYDDLIRAIWGHGNVTHHQLSQVILAARRALGDDGQTQRLIRTIPGIGYRWVGNIVADTIGTSTQTAQTLETIAPPPPQEEEGSAEPPDPPSVEHSRAIPTMERSPRHGPLIAACALLALIVIVAGVTVWQHRDDAADAVSAPPAGRTTDPFAALNAALTRGRYDEVGKGLAALPPSLADSPEARLIEIRLDIERGRFDRADAKLRIQQARAAEAVDPVWQSRLFSLQALLNGTAGGSGQDILAPAQSAVRLLESTGRTKPSQAWGEALSARGYGFMKSLRYDRAIPDLVEARAILDRVGDASGAVNAADTLARVHMRQGRFLEALALMNEIADLCARSTNPVQEIYARNAATKIQIELLRWGDALASNDRALLLLNAVPDSERRTRVLLLRAIVLTGMGRIREAGSFVEEAEGLQDDRYSPIAAATYHLGAGDLERAMRVAAEADAFEGYSANETLNLESREGALLLWLTAAQARSADGHSIPSLPSSRLAILQSPTSSVGHIARGRWLWSQGRTGEAELAFREALSRARTMRHTARMLAACEPLVALLLRRGKSREAARQLEALWRYAPSELDRDYGANLLALRVALSTDDRVRATRSYRNASALAGERRIPEDLETAYRKWATNTE
ncbi:MAG: winged helix-turn-helix domain-containing protein [Pseudomonadota bacterium]